MRKSVIFLILWGLLCLSRFSHLAHCYNQYMAARGLEFVITARPVATDEDRQTLDRVVHCKEEWFDLAVQTGAELLLLGGVCVVFFQTHKRSGLAVGEPSQTKSPTA